MKDVGIKKITLLILLPLIFIMFFYFKSDTHENPSSMIVNTSLTRLRAPNDDPIKIKPNEVEDGDSLNSTTFNYFINFNWQQNGNTIKAGDTFSLSVSGGLYVPNTTTPYNLNVTDETDPTFQATSIGDIEVFDNIITVTFNDNVNSPNVKALGNLSGTVYLQCAVDFNDPAFKIPNSSTGNFKPTLSPTIAVLDDPTKTYTINVTHYDINPTTSYLFRAAGSTNQFSSSLAGLLYPGESIEAKFTLIPTNQHKYRVSKLKFLFNDYSIDYMYGAPTGVGSRTYQDPSYNGIPFDNTKYTFTRISTTFERSEEHKKSIYIDDRRNTVGEWILDFNNNLNFTDTESYFNHYLSINGSWTDSAAFQNHTYVFMYDFELEYENNLTENIASHIKGLKDTKKCNVSVSYVYIDPITQNEIKVISDTQYNDVYIDNSPFDNYHPTIDEIQNLQDAGYTIDVVPTINLEENKDLELVVSVKQILTSVTLRFETTDDLGNIVYPLSDIIKNNIWIKDGFYINYQLTQAEILLLDSIGYDFGNIVNLSTISTNPDDNIIVIYLSETAPNNTTATTTTDNNTTTSNTTDINTTAVNTTDSNTTTVNTTTSNTTGVNTTISNTTGANTTTSNTTGANTTTSNTTGANTTASKTTSANTTTSNTTGANTTTSNTTGANTTTSKTSGANTTTSNTTVVNTTTSNTTYTPSTTYSSSNKYYGSGGGIRPTYIPRTNVANTTINTTYYNTMTTIDNNVYNSLNTLPNQIANTTTIYNSLPYVYDTMLTSTPQKSKFVSNNQFESPTDENTQSENTQLENSKIQANTSEQLNTQTTDVMPDSFKLQQPTKQNPNTSNAEKIIKFIFIGLSGVVLLSFVKGFKIGKK